MSRWRTLVVAALTVVCAAQACKRRPRDELATLLAAEPTIEMRDASLPPLTLRDETPDLSLTWVDSKGDTQRAEKPADVPPDGREQVRVVVSTREEGNGDVFYVANLHTKNPDGTYPVTTMTRAAWEAMLGKRREAMLRERAAAATPTPGLAEPAPAPGSSEGSGAPAARPTVIVYGASWCDACHQAMEYLKRRHIAAIEKDIERDPGADAEMRSKLARAGLRGASSIPILDVRGRILVGFDPQAVERALKGSPSVPL